MRKPITLLIIAMAAIMAIGAAAENLPYITRVFDYVPAPGQFVNELPLCRPGELADSVMARVEREICGRDSIRVFRRKNGTIVTDTITLVKPGMISLGSFGGYVTFGFDHPLVNVQGQRDLQIFGNATTSDSLAGGGSSEPGIVMVGIDRNGNGLPDEGDSWYELAGSEHAHHKTQSDFTITYYRPADATDPVAWTCNSTDSLQQGVINRMDEFGHTQSYWPLWIDAPAITFSGTKLRNNAVNRGTEQEPYYLQTFFGWGYVDNRKDYDYGVGDDSDGITLEQATAAGYNLGFDLDWAVDEQGNPVRLKKVDFVRVYAAMLQQCGWLGETSTEVRGAIDLHPDAPLPQDDTTWGDVNNNGSVDVADVNLIINIILGRTSRQSVAGEPDLNGNGSVDVGDVNQLVNHILTH